MRFLFLICIAILVACKNKPSSSNTPPVQTVDSTRFFEVKEYIQSQINEVNKTPYFIYKVEIIDGQKDSLPIDNTVFNYMSKQFIEPNITEPSIKHFYTENVFHDQTTKTYTFSYTTSNKELPVQNLDVLLNENPQTVKGIFIRKFYNYDNDSSAIEQLSWKPNESFQVNRLVQMGDKKEKSYQTNVVWNEKRL